MIFHFEPTPITKLKYTDSFNNYYIKREDLIPFSFGGNKVRIAAEYFKNLFEEGCNAIISYGSTKSNLNRVVANLSNYYNIPCFIVCSRSSNTEDSLESFNTKILEKLGASVFFCEKDEVSATLEVIFKKCKEMNLLPYYINGNKFGKGNEHVPVNAYKDVYDEIILQETEKNIKFDYVFLACGTGSTLAGLSCGNLENYNSKKIIGISIAREKLVAEKNLKTSIESYLKEKKIRFDGLKNVELTDKYLSGGYSLYNQEIIGIINQLMINDGVNLDTTYTGKAFWGMTRYLSENNIKNNNILFIHTGGTPLFFDDILVLE